MTSFSPKLITAFRKLNHLTLPKRLRGGFIENSLNYVQNVYLDYKTVYFDTIKDIQQRPFRASLIVGCLTSILYSMKHNPTYDDFQIQLINSNNQLSRVPESIRNRSSCDYIHELFQKNNKQLLRHRSFGVFSVIYTADYSTSNDLFQAQCKYLKPSWKDTLLEHLVDIGFLDRFWYMNYKMIDYDIKEEE